MSSIDLSNKSVLKNFLLTQMREGNGEFYYKEKVLVFKDFNGNEYVAPDEILKDVDIVNKTSEPEVSEPEVSEPEVSEPEVSEPEVKKRKKNKLV